MQTPSAPRADSFHPLPVIGHPPAFYDRHIQTAEKAGDRHAKASHKVGQYVTAGLDPKRPWDDKVFMFRRALEKYCAAPEGAGEGVQTFYAKMADLVRRHGGAEAVRAARRTHEDLLKCLKAGTSRGECEDRAEQFFQTLFGHERCPPWCSKEAASQVAEMRDYWI